MELELPVQPEVARAIDDSWREDVSLRDRKTAVFTDGRQYRHRVHTLDIYRPTDTGAMALIDTAPKFNRDGMEWSAPDGPVGIAIGGPSIRLSFREHHVGKAGTIQLGVRSARPNGEWRMPAHGGRFGAWEAVYPNVLPGVDWRLRAQRSGFKMEFVIREDSPIIDAAGVAEIKMKCSGAPEALDRYFAHHLSPPIVWDEFTCASGEDCAEAIEPLAGHSRRMIWSQPPYIDESWDPNTQVLTYRVGMQHMRGDVTLDPTITETTRDYTHSNAASNASGTWGYYSGGCNGADNSQPNTLKDTFKHYVSTKLGTWHDCGEHVFRFDGLAIADTAPAITDATLEARFLTIPSGQCNGVPRNDCLIGVVNAFSGHVPLFSNDALSGSGSNDAIVDNDLTEADYSKWASPNLIAWMDAVDAAVTGTDHSATAAAWAGTPVTWTGDATPPSVSRMTSPSFHASLQAYVDNPLFNHTSQDIVVRRGIPALWTTEALTTLRATGQWYTPENAASEIVLDFTLEYGSTRKRKLQLPADHRAFQVRAGTGKLQSDEA